MIIPPFVFMVDRPTCVLVAKICVESKNTVKPSSDLKPEPVMAILTGAVVVPRALADGVIWICGELTAKVVDAEFAPSESDSV